MVGRNCGKHQAGIHLPPLLNKTQRKRRQDVKLSREHTNSNRYSSCRNTHFCLSERGSRPKPERQWTPMSYKESLSENRKYGSDGLYSKQVDRLYNLLTRQNSIILPPIQTSRRMKHNVYDEDKLKEKRYIMSDVFTEGKMARYARDQCYVPSVYTKFLSCRTCKKSFMDNKYMEDYKLRNNKNPHCSNSSRTDKSHFCDVLGKRCCAQCIESENRLFSRGIEERLATFASTSRVSDMWFDFN